jgi:hypothetical protein
LEGLGRNPTLGDILHVINPFHYFCGIRLHESYPLNLCMCIGNPHMGKVLCQWKCVCISGGAHVLIFIIPCCDQKKIVQQEDIALTCISFNKYNVMQSKDCACMLVCMCICVFIVLLKLHVLLDCRHEMLLL